MPTGLTLPQTALETRNDNPSFILNKPNDVEIVNRELPKLSSPHDVLVDVRFTGICGSDVHYWAHGAIGAFIVKEPMVLGHESAGIVHAVGDKVTDLKPGDRVAMEPGIPCRRCNRCKEGRYNLCKDVQFAATPPVHGTLCRYYTLPSDFCQKLPDHVTLEEGALIEPLSVAVHVVRLANVQPGDKVVVYGAGPVGLLCLAVAKAYGASSTVVVDVNQTRADFAKTYAATHAFLPAKGETPLESSTRLQAECGLGDGADVAIDASGAEVCIQQAVHVCRSGATFVQAGMGKPDVNFPLMAAMAKELVIKTSFRYKQGDYMTALNLVATGKVDVKPLISKKVKFQDAEQAFKDTKSAQGIKILIEGPE